MSEGHDHEAPRYDPFEMPVVSFGRARHLDPFPGVITERGILFTADTLDDLDEWLSRAAAGVGLLHSEAITAGFPFEGHSVSVFVSPTGETSVAINARRSATVGELAWEALGRETMPKEGDGSMAEVVPIEELLALRDWAGDDV